MSTPRRTPALLLLVALAAGCGRRDDPDGPPGARAQALSARAALLAGDLDAAEAAARSAQQAGARGAVLGLAAFVRGNVAFARSEALEPEALAPGADPGLAERVRAFVEDALAAWRVAASSRADWPEARRNVERALLRLDRLRERRADGPRRPAPPPLPVPGAPPSTPPAPAPAVETGALSAAEVERLLEVLRGQERARREARRARREGAAGSERDW